jgi:predicted RecA/RadA family phage recombinase
MATVFIERVSAEGTRLKNTSGADVVTGQLVVIGGWVAVACENIAANAVGAFIIEDNYVVQASNLTVGNTFATEGQLVYQDLSGDFGDLPGLGFMAVGTLISDKASGVIRFLKFSRAIPATDAVNISGTLTDNDTLKWVASTMRWTVVAV